MTPTIGRIVIYTLSEHDKNSINGNTTDKLPAIIVNVWSDTCVNLKVITDGINDLWKTSVALANEGRSVPNTWVWPEQVN